MRVADIMSVDVVTVDPTTPLKDASVLMIERGVSGLPVVQGGRLVGIISEADFVRAEAGERRSVIGIVFGRRRAYSGATHVGDVMSKELVTVGVNDHVRHAARMMLKRNVKRLPVVDDGGELRGIISRVDILSIFARPDEEIHQEVAAFIERSMPPNDITVSVSDGVVTLDGRVDARVDAEVFVDVVMLVEGVIAVVDNLMWDVDSAARFPRFAGYPGD